MLPRLPQLSTYHRRSMVAGALTLAVALHGVELADISNIDLPRLEPRTIRAMWGLTAGQGQGGDLLPGHKTLPVMRTKYDRLGWLARVAWVPGVAQVLLQAIWDPVGLLGCIPQRRPSLRWDVWTSGRCTPTLRHRAIRYGATHAMQAGRGRGGQSGCAVPNVPKLGRGRSHAWGDLVGRSRGLQRIGGASSSCLGDPGAGNGSGN